ncbi:MAG: hypothetical protein GX654_03670 [Desulfatiglans sp.]|jgi:hypothetical protein|nr:hypothetical protein [Desulfatiglans sp.]
MRLIEWEVKEDDYQEQMHIPAKQRKISEEEGIGTAEKQKVTAQITNLKTGEIYISRFPITGTKQLYVPVEIQKMLKGSGKMRIQILGG